MSDDPRYQFKHEAIEAMLKDIGKLLGDACKPHNYGFALFLYQFGEGGGTFYISNGVRDDLTKLLTEFLERQKLEAEQQHRHNDMSEGES